VRAVAKAVTIVLVLVILQGALHAVPPEEKPTTPPSLAEEKERLKRELKKYKYLTREMVPIVKYFITEKSIQITRDNIQIHGGNGYTPHFV